MPPLRCTFQLVHLGALVFGVAYLDVAHVLRRTYLTPVPEIPQVAIELGLICRRNCAEKLICFIFSVRPSDGADIVVSVIDGTHHLSFSQNFTPSGH